MERAITPFRGFIRGISLKLCSIAPSQGLISEEAACQVPKRASPQKITPLQTVIFHRHPNFSTIKPSQGFITLADPALSYRARLLSCGVSLHDGSRSPN